MDKVFFISDVHLGAHSRQHEQTKVTRLISFLKSIRDQADYLYIVGDLYDFWFEYRKAIPKVNLRVLSELHRLVESGTEVRYFIGNHDLWHETYLATEIGLTMLYEPMAVEHNGLRLFVAHGDGLARGEWKLRLMKRIMQNRANIFLYKLLHPDLGIPLARLCSLQSKKKGHNRFIEQYRVFALQKLDNGFDAVLLGHTHAPSIEKTGSKYYINIGDWVHNYSFVKMNGAGFELSYWQD